MDTLNKVTTIDELLEMSKGEIVKLPPFVEGKDFYARLKRPSIMALVKNGNIPNSLLRAANSLFTSNVEDEANADDEFLKDMLGVIDVLADASFVEPKWTDLKAAGVELTDQQYMFIFNYTQTGIQDLEPFRQEQENTTDNPNGSIIPMQAQ